MAPKHNFDVVIVGAGISGLTAGIELGRRGLRTAIVERSTDVGGRVRSDSHHNFTLDRGFQILLSAYPEAKKYLDYDELEIRRFPRGASILTNDGIVDLTDPRDNLTSAIKSFGKVLHARDLSGLWRLSRVTDAPNDDDQSTIAQYLARCDFSESLRTSFLEPFLRGILLDPELAAPVQTVSFYMEMFAKGHAVVPARGISQIPMQLAEKVSNCQFFLDADVTAIEQGAVRLADGSSIVGNALILALDAYQLGQLTGHACPSNFHQTACHYYEAPTADVAGLMPLVLNGRDNGPINHLSIPSIVSEHYAPPGSALVGANAIGPNAQLPRHIVEAQLRKWFGNKIDRWRHLRTYTIDHALPAQGDQDAWHKFGEVAATAAAAAFGGPTAVAGDFTATASLNGAMASGAHAAFEVATAMSKLAST